MSYEKDIQLVIERLHRQVTAVEKADYQFIVHAGIFSDIKILKDLWEKHKSAAPEA